MKNKELRKIMSTGLLALTITASMLSAHQYASAETQLERHLREDEYTPEEADYYYPLSMVWQYNYESEYYVYYDAENTLSEIGYLSDHNQNDKKLYSGSDITGLIPFFKTLNDVEKGPAQFRYTPGFYDQLKYNEYASSGKETYFTFTAPATAVLRIEGKETITLTTFVNLFDEQGNRISASKYLSHENSIYPLCGKYESLNFKVKKGQTYTLKFYNNGQDEENEYNMFFIKPKPKTTSKSEAIKDGKWYIQAWIEKGVLWRHYQKNTSAPSVRSINWKDSRTSSYKISLDTQSKVKFTFKALIYERFDYERLCDKGFDEGYIIIRLASFLDHGIDGSLEGSLIKGNFDKDGTVTCIATLPVGEYYVMPGSDKILDSAFKYEVLEEYEPTAVEWLNECLTVNPVKAGATKITGTALAIREVYCEYEGKLYKTKVGGGSRYPKFTITVPALKKGKKVKVWMLDTFENERSYYRTYIIE